MLADENVDELEEELKALMEDADEMTDRLPGVLPEVPHNPLPPREMAQGGSSLLASLPDVPTNTFNISDQQLEEELNRLTLRDSGLLRSLLVLLPAKLSSDSSVVMRIFSVPPSLQTLDRRRGWSRRCEEPC